jgi:hypothetical protein
LTYNGGPVVPGTILTFVGENGASASAVASEDGSFRLLTPQGDSLPVGKYKVIVMPPKTGPELTAEEEMEASIKAQKDGVKAQPPAPFPKKYMNLMTTPESREVAEGDNEINVDLVDG